MTATASALRTRPLREDLGFGVEVLDVDFPGADEGTRAGIVDAFQHAGAVLLRPMVPLADPPAADLAGKPVLILSGAADPIVPAETARRLAALLAAAGADVEHRVLPAGHGLSQADVAGAKRWIETLRS